MFVVAGNFYGFRTDDIMCIITQELNVNVNLFLQKI